jgi:hypothetical protein
VVKNHISECNEFLSLERLLLLFLPFDESLDEDELLEDEED